MKGEPTTLESAYNSATKFEAYEQSLVTQGTLNRPLTYAVTSDDDRPGRRSRTVNAVTDAGDDAVDQLRVDELQSLLERATKGIAALAAKKGATDQGKSGRDTSGDKSSSRKGSRGKNSGRGQNGRFSGRKQDPKVDQCRNCGEVGHWAKDCPKPKQPAKEQAQANSISCQLVSPTRIYITAYVGGKPVQCLLDSGCERSVISRNVIQNARLTRSRYNLTMANKANLPILGDTTLHFEVDGNQFEANVSVSSAIDDFLLGSDWLETNGANWDFATGTLHFGDRIIRAYRRTLGNVCRQVTVSENFVVPARHEANVPVKMSDKDIPHVTDNWVIKTKQLSSRVMTARTLIDGKQKRFVARVCNYSDEPYELKADYNLARAEPVECVPEPDGKPSSYALDCNANVNVSALLRASSLSGLPPEDPTNLLRATTVNASATADGAGTTTAPGTDVTPVTEPAPSAEDLFSHIQCLLDGLPDDLTDEQRACATAFIKSRLNVFSRSEYDIGRTRILPHRIDTGDNAPHFEQLRRHPTTQLPVIDEHVQQ